MVWVEVVPPTPGTGTALFLADSDAPADQAFYRVAARR